MKRFIDTLRNIWAIDELKQRILVTLGMVLIYRLGSFVVLPGVNVDALADSKSDAGGIVGLINMFAGGAFFTCLYFWFRYYALYHCIHYYPIIGDGGAVFPKNAAAKVKVVVRKLTSTPGS